jgi:Rha family phage regulatory protein
MPTNITTAHATVFNLDGIVYASSLEVADLFGKQHGHVLRTIEGLSNSGETPPGYFLPYTRLDVQNGQPYPVYHMSRDGFTLLVMGFTGGDALRFKVAYICAFNEMEAALRHPLPRIKAIKAPAPTRITGILISRSTEAWEKILGNLKGLCEGHRQYIIGEHTKLYGVIMPEAVIQGLHYTHTQIADELHMSLWHLSRNPVYKSLQKVAGNMDSIPCKDAVGNTREWEKWTEQGRLQVLAAFQRPAAVPYSAAVVPFDDGGDGYDHMVQPLDC